MTHWIAAGAPSAANKAGHVVLLGAQLGLAPAPAIAGITYRGVGETVLGNVQSLALTGCQQPASIDLSRHLKCDATESIDSDREALFGASVVVLRREPSGVAAGGGPAIVQLAIGAPGAAGGRGAVLVVALEHNSLRNASLPPFYSVHSARLDPASAFKEQPLQLWPWVVGSGASEAAVRMGIDGWTPMGFGSSLAPLALVEGLKQPLSVLGSMNATMWNSEDGSHRFVVDRQVLAVGFGAGSPGASSSLSGSVCPQSWHGGDAEGSEWCFKASRSNSSWAGAQAACAQEEVESGVRRVGVGVQLACDLSEEGDR